MREQEEMGDIKISSPCHTAASDKKKVHNFVSKKWVFYIRVIYIYIAYQLSSNVP